MNNGNGCIRQRNAWVQVSNTLVVPLGHNARENISQQLTCQLDLTWLDAVDVDNCNHTTNDGWELDQTFFVQLFSRHRRIGGTEVNRFGFDLLDTARRTNGLVVQRVSSFCFVGFSPFCINREWERSARACEVGGHRRCSNGCHANGN